jgi:Zn-dependent M28 family amino/carboxypeptidase
VKYGLPLLSRGAKAIIFIADEEAEKSWDDAVENFKRGSYEINGETNQNLSSKSPQSITAKSPVIWFHANAKKELINNNAIVKINLVISEYFYPSVNIIGKVEGTDPKLKSEYVLYSGHSDAHGIRNIIKGDSIYYGADDNGSVDVAMLANARAFVKYPSKRSVVFVIHGAEERGLLGSKYFSEHPTVPLEKIVAVLNGDMIGRNNTDSAAILGYKPPHRNSLDLVNMALAANKEGPNFTLDTTWDNITHVEGWYFRSDHLSYARLGIPAIMYTSLLHPDYHTPQDKAENINYPKLKKMADWMYRTGWKVANTPIRPATDKDFKLER